jgi:hypothetical protein
MVVISTTSSTTTTTTNTTTTTKHTVINARRVNTSIINQHHQSQTQSNFKAHPRNHTLHALTSRAAWPQRTRRPQLAPPGATPTASSCTADRRTAAAALCSFAPSPVSHCCQYMKELVKARAVAGTFMHSEWKTWLHGRVAACWPCSSAHRHTQHWR